MSLSYESEQRSYSAMTKLALRVAAMLAAASLLLLAACASDESDDAQRSATPTCLASVDDSNWTDADSFSKDDIAWFNAPDNFAQYASTCQTAAITALVIGNQYGKGDQVDTDPGKTVEWWQKSAALGDIEAEDQLGYLYSVKYGNGFLPASMRDDQKAFQWWGRAAAKGNVQAANMVASMYLMGAGVAKDYCGAVSMLLKFANTGDHTAEFQLGQCYENGWGVPQDDSKARYWLLQAQGNGSCLGCIDTRKELSGLGVSPAGSQDTTSGSSTGAHQARLDEHDQKMLDHEQRAAAKGDVAAELWLGKVYLTGILNGKVIQADWAKSFAWFRKAADKGNAAGEDNVGHAYRNGWGVKQDSSQAVFWYKKAASKGNVDAEDWLGHAYWAGDGVPRDYAKSLAWYRRAAATGDASGETSIGNAYQYGWAVKQDYVQALSWYKKAADKGYAQAEDLVGYAYWSGHVVPRDYVKSLAWYQKAAAQGDATGQFSVGNAYLNGWGVKQDYAQALTWYQKAADQGDAQGEDDLGNVYQNGWGVTRDYTQAVSWYQKAADQGNVDAENWLGHDYWAGQGVPRDDRKSLAWYQKAADQGNAVGEYSVGNFYRNGWGVQQDLSQATAWYQKAADQGYADAKQALANMQSQTVAAQAAPSDQSDTSQSDTSDSQSVAEWQQEHQAKIDELTQEIGDHEQQAQQDDANADEAEAQAQQNADANTSGPGGAFLALGNAVEGGLNAGLAVKERQDAADERRQAQEERDQLAELGAEQPPVAQNDSEQMTLTQMQTQAIQSGDTIEGQMNRARNNIQAARPPEGISAPQPQASSEQTSSPAVATSETCPNLHGYPDYGVGCNSVREENSCVGVVSNVWNAGALEETLVLSNTCASAIRITAWGSPNSSNPGETLNLGPGQQYTFSNNQQTWHYHADDGVDCPVNNDRPGCSLAGLFGH